MENLINKTTLNFANNRGIYVAVHELEDYNHLTIVSNEDESDAELAYIANEDGSYTYKSNTWISQQIKEELPATIRDEKHLREVIQFLSIALA